MKGIKLLMILMLSMSLSSVVVLASDEENVWRPSEPFFVEHMEECITENREYYANGPNGQVIIYESPASSKLVGTMKNGEVVRVDYVFTNDAGVTWGFCEFEGEFGWLPMPYMVVVYDYISFEEEYANQFKIESDHVSSGDGSYDFYQEYDGLWRRMIKFWSYPGSSDKLTLVLEKESSMTSLRYIKTFIDEDGLKWGFVDYFAGKTINRWVCLSVGYKMFADFEELYPMPEWAPIRDKRVIEPYTGEEIFPDDYEEVQRMQKVRTVAISIGIVVVAAAVILFYWKMWKKVKQA